MSIGDLLVWAALIFGGTWLLVFVLRRAGALHYLFPPHDKVAVFLMTVGLLGVFFLYADLPMLAPLAWKAFVESPFANLVLAVVLATAILAGLSLPFTTEDMRGLATSLVAINAVLMVAANVYYPLTHPDQRTNVINWLFVWYWATWLLALRKLDDHEIIGDRATTPRRARIAGAACIAMIVTARLLDVAWIWAYVFSVAIASSLHRAIDRVLASK